MFYEVFLKNFLVISGKVLIFKVFRVKSFFKVFFWKSGAWGFGGIWGVFLFGLPFPWFPIRVSLHLRFASDDSPIFLRSPNGEWTELERSLNGGWTELERSLNGARTELERSSNGGWTELERSLNGARTELERSPNGARTELERSLNGGWTENDRKPNGERTEELTLLAKRSVFLRYDIGMPSELSSAKMERVLASLRAQNYKAKSKFSANLWCFENAERWKYRANK